MESIHVWWAALSHLNQWFYIAAMCFGVLFVWQLIMTFVGIGAGDEGIDTHVDTADHHAPDDMQATVDAFRLFSIRSILAFFTLFTWAGAIYLNQGRTVGTAMLFAFLWGLGAMVAVSLVLHMMKKLTESGVSDIRRAVGESGSVYLDIPAGGQGEVRVNCGGMMSLLKARACGGGAIKAGTPVKVVRVLDTDVVEVTVA
jgi:hypothetical protein